LWVLGCGEAKVSCRAKTKRTGRQNISQSPKRGPGAGKWETLWNKGRKTRMNLTTCNSKLHINLKNEQSSLPVSVGCWKSSRFCVWCMISTSIFCILLSQRWGLGCGWPGAWNLFAHNRNQTTNTDTYTQTQTKWMTRRCARLCKFADSTRQTCASKMTSRFPNPEATKGQFHVPLSILTSTQPVLEKMVWHLVPHWPRERGEVSKIISG
jgi:hypothetical protein